MVDQAYIDRIKAATQAGIAHQRRLVKTGRAMDPWEEERLKSKRRAKSPDDIPTEWQEQRMVCQWLHARKVVYFAVPNGGSRRGAIEGARLKMIGLKPGVPDLIILSPPPSPKWPYPDGGYVGAVIEMKRRKGGKVSEEQKEWLEHFASYTWATCVANGADEAIKQLEEWGY